MPPTAAELIDLLIDRAPRLIAVGITSLSIDGMSATLSKPAAVAAPAGKPQPVAKQHSDPMRDPATYQGGKVPGFTREEEKTGGRSFE